MKNPKVFIVVLNFNSYMDTVECLNSLKNIDYENYEVIIVDNSSVDGSFEKLKDKFKSYIILKTKENKGYANGNNLGIDYALKNGAEYICVLNNDVVVESDFLSKIIDVMKDKKVGIAGPCICSYDNRQNIQAMGANINLYTGLTQAKSKGKKYSDFQSENIKVDYLGGACFVIKREVIDKIGAIPENYFLFFEETEFCLSAARIGYELVCVCSSKVYHKGSSTISKYSGLSYYFLNRNRVVFMRRNANVFQMLIFSIYIFIEAVGRIIIRHEPTQLLKNIISGFKCNKYKIDIEKVKTFTNN